MSCDVKKYIQDLASAHGVVYTETSADRLADTITQLSGDEVQPDHIEDLLVALRRVGVITCAEMVELLGRYLDEKHRN